MDQHDQQQRHFCKICDRTFPCGQSLGGHMRSHHLNLPSDTANNAGPSGISSSINNDGTSYSLRENPKQSTRFDEGVSNENLCNLCGKRFGSGKALFGHMKCHSEKLPVNSIIRNEVSSHSHSNTESDMITSRKRSSERTLTKTNPVSNISFANGSHPDDAENEQEDGARSLMMLSKDNWGQKEFSGNDEVSVRYEAGSGIEMQQVEMHNEQVQLFKKPVNCPENSEFSKRASKRNKFQCTACNKIFNSYQALGGHRASHKKIKGCFASKMIQPSENSSEKDHTETIKTESDMTAAPINQSHIPPQHVNDHGKCKKHECPLCFKVFPSGQALGGHKRTHLSNLDSNQGIVIQEPVTVTTQDLLDLNLPAPAEDDTPTPVTDFSKPSFELGACSERDSLIQFSV